jgi:hypothetical protein
LGYLCQLPYRPLFFFTFSASHRNPLDQTMPDGGELINGLPAEYWNESRVNILIGASIFLIVITVITIVARFYARISSRTPLWWDDWFALATVVSSIMITIFAPPLVEDHVANLTRIIPTAFCAPEPHL